WSHIMAYQIGSNEESRDAPFMNFVPTEIAAIGKKRIEAIVEMQKDFLAAFEEMNQAWFSRARSEASIATELVSRLTSARSVPETRTAYQECMGKRLEMLAEDSRRLLADSQKFMQLGTKFLMNGSATNGSGT